MEEGNNATSRLGGMPARIVVISAGMIIFALLLFADKTNLTNKSDRNVKMSGPAKRGGANDPLSTKSLPPLAPDTKLDDWISKSATLKGQERKLVLDSIVNNLLARGRYAHAATYATKILEEDDSFENRLQTGTIYQKATRLDFITQDSILFRQFSDKSINYLERITKENPNNEDGLLYLGLAYTESRIPQNSMKGIMTLKKVLDINPDNLQASFNLGLFSIQTGQFDKAEKRFLKVLEIQADYYPAKYYLAYAKLKSGKPDGAKKLLEEVVKKAKSNELKLQAQQLLKQL